MMTDVLPLPAEAVSSERFPRHPLEAPELTLRENFYPFGFPIELRTNSPEVLRHFGDAWGRFSMAHRTDPIEVDVHVVDGEDAECPSAPRFRLLYPLTIAIADQDNYSVTDLARGRTQIVISSSTLRHPLYLRYFLLDSAASIHIASRFTTPIHAGCVAIGGRGILLCGESGAGKSTLSYACAGAGFEYISDDAVFLLNSGHSRVVMGNCHQLRLRPAAATLFPEIAGLEVTPRAAGKPSIELPPSWMHQLPCVEQAQVDFLVFLNRDPAHAPGLVPYSPEKAREYFRDVLFGLPEQRLVQYRTIERLLTAEVMELRYTDLAWAVGRLRSLAQEGR
jgi:hypothetical protein